MFIRKKKSAASDKRTVEIVKNKRFGDKVRQVIVAYIGVIRRAEDEEQIMALAKLKLLELIKEESSLKNKSLSDEEAQQLTKRGRKKQSLLPQETRDLDSESIVLGNLKEEYRLVDGLDDIVGKVFDSLQLTDLLKSRVQNILFKNLVLTRVGFAQSKRQLCVTMRQKMDKQYTEAQVYRLMDRLYPEIKKIKQKIFHYTHSLMPSANILLFDVTTLYFESTAQDELREFGFGKDGKINNTQLVLALATNERGLPIGYEVFAGNCAEVHTLFSAIQEWRQFLPIQNICFIGDRAMFSEDNLKLIEEHGYDYIIAAKLRSQSIELQQKILDKSLYNEATFGEEKGRISEFDVTTLNIKIRCMLNTDALGYTAVTKNQEIIRLSYRSPCGIQKNADEKLLLDVQPELQKLKRYTRSTSCVLMTQEDYELKSDTLQNDIVIFQYGLDIVLSDPPNLLPANILFIYQADEGELRYSMLDAQGQDIRDIPLMLPDDILPQLLEKFKPKIERTISIKERQIILELTKQNVKADLIIYKKKHISANSLKKTLQKKLFHHIEKGKIPASLMKELFNDLFSPTIHISIPEKIVIQLFPEYRPVQRRLCVSYKPTRAGNDAYKRQKILSRLVAKEGSVSKVVKSAAKTYMSTYGNARLDDSKITEAEKWDGLHGIITNIKDEKPQDLLFRYASLWRIEESFRINKHQLSMRPIYHFKPRRIHSHLAICYVAFTALRLIEYQTELTQTHLTIDRILAALLSAESSIYYDISTEKRYKMPGYTSDDANILYRAFGVKRQNKPSPYLLRQNSKM
jgi:transposase